MKNKNTCLLILAIILITFSGCESHPKPETVQQPGTDASGTQGEITKSKILVEYIHHVRDKVMSNWRQLRAANGMQGSLAIASFKLHSDGNIDKPSIVQTSGNVFLDQLALDAVQKSVPFSRIPPELNKPFLQVKINFNYNVMNVF